MRGDYNMTTGEKISKLRKDKGYTQEEFGDLLGVTRQSVSKWESDLSFPETEKLVLIAKMFNCSLDYLFNIETNQSNKEDNKKINKVIKGDLIKGIVTTAFAVITIILYFFPMAHFPINYYSIVYPGSFYIKSNFYNFLFSGSYQLGNVFALIHFLSTIGLLTTGVLCSVSTTDFNARSTFSMPSLYALSSLSVMPSVHISSVNFTRFFVSSTISIPRKYSSYIILFLQNFH